VPRPARPAPSRSGAPSAARTGIGYDGPIVDVHTHPCLAGPPTLRAEPYRASDYLRSARGLDLRGVGALVMAPRSDASATRRQNDQVLALGRQRASVFYPVCSVHPLDGASAVAEIERVAAGGAKGLKLHPNTQDFDVADPSVEAAVCTAAEHGLPVLFDAYSPFDADQPGKFVRLAMAVPTARLVLAHAHGPRFPDLLVYEILARYPWWKRNVWIDLSATGPLLARSPFAEQFAWVLRQVGVDRLLFGSDYPLDDPTTAVAAIAGLGFSRAELRRIFYTNAARLYDLDG
jgi:predicted TIM-barrel fold metal-dependent hydrolase